MFWHLYKYRVKVLLKNKYLLFWLGLFPIILGTFFNMAFSDISEKTEHIDAINVAVTTDNKSENGPEKIVERDEAFATFLETMEEREYFNITYAAYEDAMTSLSEEKADGVLVVSPKENGTEMSLVFAGSGMNQTILKNIINTYKHGASVIEDTMKNKPQAIGDVINKLYSDVKLKKDLTTTAKNMDVYNQYYFALFAMTCMFGASFGMFNTEHCQADQSAVGIRRASSPTKKMMMVLSEYLAAVTIIELLFMILVVYLTVVLGVDLGDRYGLIILASFVSSLMGVALGYFFGVILKCRQSIKEGAMMAVILFLNFLAGLMMGNMKYIIEKACPIVNRINPAAIISDCFYSICAYNDTDMYFRCIISTAIWTVVLAVASIFVLRREKYANL